MSHPAICCGDQSAASFDATISRSVTREANAEGFGRAARAQAAASVRAARYPLAPPLANASRLTIEGDLFNEAAINRIDQSAANPREISSRSANVNRSAARVRGAGRIPPLR